MSLWSSVKFAQRYAQLPTVFYRLVTPQQLDNSRWVIWNGELAQGFALPEHADDPQLLAVFSGAEPFSAFKPLAMKYAGHQFGVYNPDLGDGRGLLLAEMQNQQGQWFDIHLKGAGLTPFSRMGDGRAVLRSTLREYLCSEAMAALGIETTRALGMMVSDTPVYREQVEQGACLIRLAQTHIRFGHFEHFFYTEQYDELRLFADNVIEWYLPDCLHQPKPYLAMFEQVVAKTATMIAQWQAVGFAHGVMNTDNMSILGQTFDYGPFGFLDDYEPGYICNHSDYQGRYAFDQQPRVALWNLSALAHALSPLIDRDDLELALAQYEPTLGKVFSQLMRQKLGLLSQQEGDSELFNAMFTLLAENHTDYTRFFRTLSQLDREHEQTVIDLFVDRDAAHGWLSRYLERVALEQTASGEVKSAPQRCEQMRSVNPKYILRNYLAQQAIDKAQQGDFSEVHTLAKLLKNPYDDQPEMEAYARLPPEWGKKMVISCSS
ncbi:protein adenylyltransferase SelO [Vibrio vulnificus]|uniref:protein adenylyltransferase SelO n=1 Tax=Vibrio vulnificus TaxID=672 RepID=UPI000CD31D8D|nr:YdiU family protein [Vibrio vulnificus]EGS1995719.1 YdiU family protein [Vibrio vulnificus]EHV9836742.1 YdiU family protein [Vibrio vulnificus]EIF3174890.1 YdiU family protein [Vibrio vulnificus]EIJ0954778.1 YdiU family protein [Vibrio vulnificus]EIJ0958205.1 YdiU family protein [Vibrio vulnificus]